MSSSFNGAEIYEKYGRFYIPLIFNQCGQIFYSSSTEGTIFITSGRLEYYNIIDYKTVYVIPGEEIEFQSPLDTKLGEALYG
ncbi:MAG: hypothetical protein HC836_45300 [Richelia sp. RM2_1_2]|nr:hypothetical protein [Richelia sp. RM2_1_2]